MRLSHVRRLMMCVAILPHALAITALDAAEDAASGGQKVLRIHMIGVGEYRPVESLTILKEELEKHYRVEITTSLHPDKTGKVTSMPNLESLKEADVMVIFTRRMNLPEEQMAIIRKHWEQGKGIVAMRTASHAFQPADNEIFDRQVLGGHYGGAANYTTPFTAIPADGQAEHPVLTGVGPITSRGYYGNRPLAEDTVVVQVNDEPERKVKRPVTWLHTYKGGRTFYTSMGMPEDFQNENFRRLLTNAIFWTAHRDLEKMKK